jgi:peroxiredoxin
MQDRTETLEIGSRAPEFALPSANREGSSFSLSTMLGSGPVIVEFLRGTW